MPNRKTDINNRQALSTNNIGMNYDYPDGDHATRERIMEDHRLYQQGHMWAMANHPRVPDFFREEYSKWGLAADEFTEHGNWTPQLYISCSSSGYSNYTKQDSPGSPIFRIKATVSKRRPASGC